MRTFIALLALGLPADGLAAGNPDLAPFGWFAMLRGACWHGEHPDGKTAETRCYATQYDRVMRGTIKVRIGREGGIPAGFEGDSVYTFDPKRNRVVYAQWASNGSLGMGEMEVDGEVLRFHNRLPDGTPSRVRSVWRRLDADSFRVTRERREGDAWKEAFSVTYRRAR